jgi:hypothetical protein
MAKSIRKKDDEVVEVYYCVNPRTFAIERIHCTRDNVLKKYDDEGVLISTHHDIHGSGPAAEIRFAWGYVLILTLPAGTEDTHFSKERIALVHERAEAMRRAAREKRKLGAYVLIARCFGNPRLPV